MYHASVGICRDLLYQLGPKGVLDKRSCYVVFWTGDRLFKGRSTLHKNYREDGTKLYRVPVILGRSREMSVPVCDLKGRGHDKGKASRWHFASDCSNEAVTEETTQVLPTIRVRESIALYFVIAYIMHRHLRRDGDNFGSPRTKENGCHRNCISEYS